MEARSSVGATLIASQCEPEQWYVRFSSELIADSTLSRLAGSARYLELEGPDMRRCDTMLEQEQGWKEVTTNKHRRQQVPQCPSPRAAGTIHRLPAVPTIVDALTKHSYFPKQQITSQTTSLSQDNARFVAHFG